MSKSFVAVLLVSAAAASFATSGHSEEKASATGQTVSVNAESTDRGYALYQRVVLGYTDGIGGGPVAARQPEPQLTEGPYARYLMNDGFAKGDALASAQRNGEQPRQAVEKPAPRPLTSYETYRMVVLGQPIAALPAGTTN